MIVATTTALVAITVACGAPSGSDGSSAGPATRIGNHRVDLALGGRIDQYFTTSYTDGFANVRAVLVNVGGQTVLEKYNRSTPDATSNVFSVTKSVMSILIGIALDERRLTGTDQTLAELLPAYSARMAPPVRSITLGQVLTMTAGLKADPAGEEFVNEADWVGSIVAATPDRPPGGVSRYSSESSHLLSAILAQATGRTVLDYAREKLFTPLGINTVPAAEPEAREGNPAAYDAAGFAWPVDPQGFHTGHALLKLTAPDMAKLGQLYLNKGQWNGRQLVSAAWVAESTRAHAAASGPVVLAKEYGYQWWVTTADKHPAFAAMGYAGQLIEVVPELDLVVVVSSVEGPYNSDGEVYAEMVNSVVAPAVHPAN